MNNFPASFDLSTLASGDGTNGFVLNGIDERDYSGTSVSSVGDVNGDGFDDVIIGVARTNFGITTGVIRGAGESYVVFGQSEGFGGSFDLADLDGSNGFRLDGIDAYDYSGGGTSAGDVNGDGFDDIIIGAARADPVGLRFPEGGGESYVVFGKATGFGASFDLAILDGNNGFRIDGAYLYDGSGSSVSSAGDVNGDGFDDVIVGAPNAGDSSEPDSTGRSYVVFGKAAGFDAFVSLGNLDGNNGFILDGVDGFDESGTSVSSAGDVNGDGFDDLIIGNPSTDSLDPDGFAGEVYVVFGKATGFDASFELSSLDGSNGFRLGGIDPFDGIGRSISSAGDVNGDGFDDVIIGSHSANNSAGESYVVFGKASGFDASFDLTSLDGINGFRLDGIDEFDASGRSVSSAGDVNDDGFDDLIIGASNSIVDGKVGTGESYVVFGKAAGFGASFDLGSLDGSNGFRLDGVDRLDASGSFVSSAGDFNGDGVDDLIIGAPRADPGGINFDPSGVDFAGETYIVYGGGFPNNAPVASATLLTGDEDTVLSGTATATDADGDLLTFSKASDPTNGMATVAADGAITYTPDADFNGTDSFTYTVSDGNGGTATQTVSVSVAPVDDPTVSGGPDDDVLVGTAADDLILGEAGDDFLVGGGAVDLSTSLAAQVYRIYQATLDRVPDTVGFEGWVDALDSGSISLQGVITGFTNSGEFQNTYGSLDNSGFVTLLYNNVLDRAPDEGGLNGWLDAMTNGTSRAQVVAGFSESGEFRANTSVEASAYTEALDGRAEAGFYDDVYRLYQATLDRAPDAVGLESWSDQLADGREYTAVAAGFTNSGEFRNTYGDLTDSEFVDQLYRNVLDREADAGGRQGWLNVIDGGGTREDVVRGFAQSGEFVGNTAAAFKAYMKAGGGNTLDGGSGNDTLYSGTTADTFVFTQKSTIIVLDNGTIITDRAPTPESDTVLQLDTWDTLKFNDFGFDERSDVLQNLEVSGGDILFEKGFNSILFVGASLETFQEVDYVFT